MSADDDFEEVLSRFRPAGPPASMQLPTAAVAPTRGRTRSLSKWMMPLGVCAGVVLMGGTAAVWWRQTQAPDQAPGAPTPATARYQAPVGGTIRPRPEEMLRVGRDIKAPFQTRSVAPAYAVTPPPGVVAILELTVDPQGVVNEVRILRGDDQAATDAANAARQWRYEPVAVDGEPKWFVMTVVIHSP